MRSGLVSAVAALALFCAMPAAHAADGDDVSDDSAPDVAPVDESAPVYVVPDRAILPEDEGDVVAPKSFHGAPVDESQGPDDDREDGPVTGFEFDSNAGDLLDGFEAEDQ